MPLRDHFRPPVLKHSSWEGFHGMWPASMVFQLTQKLPPEYVAEPRAHLGSYFEIDVSAYEENQPGIGAPLGNGGVATATWAPPAPALTIDTDFTEQYEYEV